MNIKHKRFISVLRILDDHGLDILDADLLRLVRQTIDGVSQATSATAIADHIMKQKTPR